MTGTEELTATGNGSAPGGGDGSAAGQAGESPAAPDELDALVGTWWTIPDVAEALGIDVIRVRQLLRDGQLLALRGGERNVLRVPADFIQYGRVLKGLPGTLTVLADSGYSPEERMVWLFTADDTLPGSPVAALRENRGTEVRRRAQASAF